MATDSSKYTMPSYNSQGMQVWDPSVGLYHSPGSDNAESFGGIVTALQDQMVASGGLAKAYPYSFAGIISAIQNLTIEVNDPSDPGAEIGEAPIHTVDGTLWFDTRQGRLFVAFENEWYQANGADGLPIVTQGEQPNATNLPNGQTWWNALTNTMYIFEGTFWTGVPGESTITTDPAQGTSPVWIAIIGENTGLQTTATLPLVNSPDDPDGYDALTRAAVDHTVGTIPPPAPDSLKFQENANLYLMECITALDTQLDKQVVTVSETAPSDPVVGQLWFDTDDIELSIWYVDSSGGQWVPTFSAYMFDQNLAEVKASLAGEIGTRTAAIESLNETTDSLSSSLTSLTNTVAEMPTMSTLSVYAKEAEQQGFLNNIQNQVTANDGEISNIYKNYMTSIDINNKFSTVDTAISALPTQSALDAVEAKIVTDAATTAYVDSKVASVPANLPTAGGTITGSFKLQNTDVAKPALDFTGKHLYGRVAQKYETYCSMPDPRYVTFGSTGYLYEYAWDFADNEDFCWKHDGTKVASIDKNGIAATALKIANFGTNTFDGRRLLNTIDIGETLQAIKTAVTTSTDYASLKSGLTSALANV